MDPKRKLATNKYKKMKGKLPVKQSKNEQLQKDEATTVVDVQNKAGAGARIILANYQGRIEHISSL